MASSRWMAPREGGYTGGPDGPVPPPPATRPESSDEALVAAVSAALQRDFRLRIGPNTRRHITNGQERIPLTLRECDDIATAAVAALRKATP